MSHHPSSLATLPLTPALLQLLDELRESDRFDPHLFFELATQRLHEHMQRRHIHGACIVPLGDRAEHALALAIALRAAQSIDSPVTAVIPVRLMPAAKPTRLDWALHCSRLGLQLRELEWVAPAQGIAPRTHELVWPPQARAQAKAGALRYFAAALEAAEGVQSVLVGALNQGDLHRGVPTSEDPDSFLDWQPLATIPHAQVLQLCERLGLAVVPPTEGPAGSHGYDAYELVMRAQQEPHEIGRALAVLDHVSQERFGLACRLAQL